MTKCHHIKFTRCIPSGLRIRFLTSADRLRLHEKYSQCLKALKLKLKKRYVSLRCAILRIERLHDNCVDPDVAAHYVLPRLDIRCSQAPEVLVVNSSFMKKRHVDVFKSSKEHWYFLLYLPRYSVQIIVRNLADCFQKKTSDGPVGRQFTALWKTRRSFSWKIDSTCWSVSVKKQILFDSTRTSKSILTGRRHGLVSLV